MMHDTSPEMEEKMCEMIRMKSPFERLKMGASMYDVSKRLILQAILKDNPEISKTALKQELFLKFYRNDVDPIQLREILKHFEMLELNESKKT